MTKVRWFDRFLTEENDKIVVMDDDHREIGSFNVTQYKLVLMQAAGYILLSAGKGLIQL